MVLRLRNNLLAEQIENVGLQENIQIAANFWTVPSAQRMVNLSMKQKVIVKSELTSKENSTFKLEDTPKVTCKICYKKIINTNLGKHTYKVHCLTMAEYQEIYGKLSQDFAKKRKVDQPILSSPEVKKIKTECKKTEMKYELSRVENYKKMTSKELLEELEKVLGA